MWTHSLSVVFLLLFSQVSFSAVQSDSLLLELTGKRVVMDDRKLYMEVIEAYRRFDTVAMAARTQALLRNFPSSAFADNALYLMGSLSLEQKDYAKALEYYGQIPKKFPNGSRVSASLFAKGIVYKRMGIKSLARAAFQKVITHYPGSPESFRANMELKVL